MASMKAHPLNLPRRRHAVERVFWRCLLMWRFRLFQRHRHRKLVIEKVCGIPLIVLPDVFNPALFIASEIFGHHVAYHIAQGTRVLDLGCGSGIGAVIAAQSSDNVIAADINPAAVRCTRLNAILNALEDRITVVESDLFSHLAGERFDVILFNPPFYREAPGDLYEHAWKSVDVMRRFAEQLTEHLTDHGYALVILSASEGNIAADLHVFSTSSLKTEIIATQKRYGEIFNIIRIGVNE